MSASFVEGLAFSTSGRDIDSVVKHKRFFFFSCLCHIVKSDVKQCNYNPAAMASLWNSLTGACASIWINRKLLLVVFLCMTLLIFTVMYNFLCAQHIAVCEPAAVSSSFSLWRQISDDIPLL